MIDVNLPTSLRGILALLVVGFVVIAWLYTTGFLPVLLAVVVGLAAGFVVYVAITRFVQWAFHAKPIRNRRRNSGNSGGGRN